MHQGSLQLGLPAPSRWRRQRLCLQVTSSEVASAEKFPSAHMIGSLLDVSMRSAWEDFVNGLGKLDIDARVYGSFGWQLLTGLSYVRPQSDIDLLMTVRSAYEADLLTTALGECGIASPRLDGEICFPDGSATAWREWEQWRSKASSRILVKRHDRAVLEAGDDWHALACAVPTSLCQ